MPAIDTLESWFCICDDLFLSIRYAQISNPSIGRNLVPNPLYVAPECQYYLSRLKKNIMGIGHRLVNIDKKQQIGFYNVDTGIKIRELSGTIVASTIVTYYLLTNPGNRIG